MVAKRTTGPTMFNGTLKEFVSDVIAKGQIGYGDVRRLQRHYLPGGISNRVELELLISLNARLVRADKAWALWLVAVVAEFVATLEVRRHPGDEAADEWIRRLLAVPTTSLGRRIAQHVRRGLGRRHGTGSMDSKQPHLNNTRTQQPSQSAAPESDIDSCPQRKRKPPCCALTKVQSRSGPLGSTFRLAGASATYGWCLAGYLRAVQRPHLMNFQGSSVSVILAPCR